MIRVFFLALALAACGGSSPPPANAQNRAVWPAPANEAEREADAALRAAFPNATAPAPFKYTRADGSDFLLHYTTERKNAWSTGQGKMAPLFTQLNLSLGEEADFKAYFQALYETIGLAPSAPFDGQYSDGWRTHGFHYMATFGDGRVNGQAVRYFADFYGAGEPFTLTLFVAPKPVFESWDGALMPLAFNGYVGDPEAVDAETRAALRSGDAQQWSEVYMALVDRKMNGLMQAWSMSLMESVNAMRRMNMANESDRYSEWVFEDDLAEAGN